MTQLQMEIGKAYIQGNGYVHVIMEEITATSHNNWDPSLFINGYRFYDDGCNPRMPDGSIYYTDATCRIDFVREVEMDANELAQIKANYMSAAD